MEFDLTKLKKRVEVVHKDRETLKSDLNRSAIQRQKIEGLCRELQKENKRVKVLTSTRSQ